MHTQRQFHGLGSIAGLTLAAALACQLETVELRSVSATQDDVGSTDAPGPVTNETVGDTQGPLTQPAQVTPNRPESKPELDFYQPLPDVVDLSPLPERGC